MEYIITFPNTNSAIKSEHFLLAEGLAVSVMPLPGQVKAGCGICLRLSAEEIGRALHILDEKSIGETHVYARTGTEGGYIYDEADGRMLWNKN